MTRNSMLKFNEATNVKCLAAESLPHLCREDFKARQYEH